MLVLGFFAAARCIRLADGPDEVHMRAVFWMELRNQISKSKI